MSTRIVTRKTSRARKKSQELTFTRDLIPAPIGSGVFSDMLYQNRQRAWEIFSATPMPTSQDEPWRRTDLRNLQADAFRLPPSGGDESLPSVPMELLQPLVSQEHGGQIVLGPAGHAEVALDASLSKKGVIFTDFRTAEREYPELLSNLKSQIVSPEEGKFAALATALAANGILVYVPKGLQLEDPLHSVVWGPGKGLAHLTHLLVWVEDGASLTYVHESASPDEAPDQTLHAGVVEIHVGAGGNLRLVELQSWGEHVWNFTHERARIGRDSQIDWIYGGLGTQLTKSFIDLDLDGPGASGRMSGFFFTHNNQHLDLDTQQNHLAPNTTSDLLYKGALEGRSRSVWQGMIYVAPGAQKTDGYQANRNLVLSPRARADSIPGLEILADDVRCTHGATVGKIDPELVFYLRSRGLRFPVAKRLVVEGFFDPIMQRIPFEGVRDRFQNAILEKISLNGQPG